MRCAGTWRGWGEPRTLASLLLVPPHGLLTQSYAPRRQQHGHINADGWGVGFFTPGRALPARWRSERPLWTNASFASVAPVLASRCVIAAVRSATPGMPIEESAVAPFTDGQWLLSHNGRVDRSVLSADPVTAGSICDAALLAQHIFATRPAALAQTVVEVGDRDPAARLNLLLTDGRSILATTWGDTLSYLVDDDGCVVASEPYDDDPRWVDVPDQHLLEATESKVTVSALKR